MATEHHVDVNPHAKFHAHEKSIQIRLNYLRTSTTHMGLFSKKAVILYYL